MLENLKAMSMVVVMAPLVGAIIAGLLGKKIGRAGAHWITISLVGLSLCLSLIIANQVIFHGQGFNGTIYTWGISGNFTFNVGFLIDRLSALMMVVVTFVSFLVHVYSMGYMDDDPGYQRFFSYISLFTFAMLMLVTSNNFLQIFFGWEAVGVVSYFLIGFWFKREPANFGSLKAFLVNRVGDFGFLLGIAAVLQTFGTLDFVSIFANAETIAAKNIHVSIFPGTSWSLITVICILLFIGAMGKSAQVPLHVWLPESMEGPTPISALIHAATMVTAGVFMVSRMSPLYELSEVALSMILVIGATGALFMGFLGIVQHDIKRVVAYSTLSQLGYMMAALGASAFSAGMFHLATHACFKALLFLGAGSVIIAMHHDQDMRNMGNLRKYMPITYITFLVGALSLSAIPPFAGFYSKDAIIEAVHEVTIPGGDYAYICVLLGAFVTALYTFRAFFLTFHGKERIPAKTKPYVKESPASVWIPLAVLAVPSLVLGGMMAGPILYDKAGIFQQPADLLGPSVYVAPQYDVMAKLSHHWHGAWEAAFGAALTAPFWLAIAGIFVAWFTCVKRPHLREDVTKRFPTIYKILVAKYGFDDFNQWFFVRGCRKLADYIFRFADAKFIDDWLVNGSGRVVGHVSRVARHLQTGYLYHYAFAMILGLVVFLIWLFV